MQNIGCIRRTAHFKHDDVTSDTVRRDKSGWISVSTLGAGVHARRPADLDALEDLDLLPVGNLPVARQVDRQRPGGGTGGGVLDHAGRVERGIIKVQEEVEIVGIKATTKTTCTGVEMFRKLLDEGRAGENVGILLRCSPAARSSG